MKEDVERESRSMGLSSLIRCWSFLLDLIPNISPLPTVTEPDRISDLPDDLLVRILLCIPTKDAVTTCVLCKRWRYVWTKLPELVFNDEEDSESVVWFIEKSMQLHKAPILTRLVVKLFRLCSVDVDVGKWVEKAVNRGVEDLDFNLFLRQAPISFPKSLYTCNTLVNLTLSHDILVDVSFSTCLPSLLYLDLICVMYKDEDSLVTLLSNCSVLERLKVQRRHFGDNLTNITVTVPSLEIFNYQGQLSIDIIYDDDDDDIIGSLVIDSPALTQLELGYVWKNYLLIENMPCLNMACISTVYNRDDKFLTSLSSVIHLRFYLTRSVVALCNTIKFSRLIELYISSDQLVQWLEPFMFLLENSPKLKILTIDDMERDRPQPCWNQPSSVPGCLLSHLEILRWNYYGGREHEKQLVAYILAYSKCLKTVEISFIATCNLEEAQKELESMPRISKSSRLIFPTEIDLWFNGILLSKF